MDAEFDAPVDAPTDSPTMKTVTAVTVSPATASIAVGTMQQFKANATFSDGTMMDVTSTATWSSSAMGTATVSSSGQATAVAKGSATITATYMSKSGTATLTITGATLKSIAVTPTNPSIVAGLTQQFSATGSFSDGSTQDLTMTATWSSSSTATATINATGLAKAVAAGTSTISAVSMGVTGKTTLTVTKANLLSIQVTPNPANTNVGGATVQFKAVGNYSDGTTPDITSMVTWASSQTTFATINAAGLATPAATGNGGTTNITATLGSVTGTAVLVVKTATITTLTISAPTTTIAAGTTDQFTATAGYSDGSMANVTSQATWASGTTATATINATGLATGVAAGTTAITASFGGLMSAPTTLTVTNATVTGLTIAPMVGNTYLGGANVPFTATATFTAGPPQNVTTSATWSSSNMAIATISNTAPNQGVASPGTTAGTATITATFMGTTATASLVVGSAQIVALNIQPAMASIAAGTNQQFQAIATYSAGPAQNVTSSATWQSSSTSNATVNSSGLAHGVAATGATPVTITATFSGQQATAQLTVTAAMLTGITISSNPTAPATIANGTNISFTAQGQYSDGTTPDITTLVTWNQNPNSGYLSFLMPLTSPEVAQAKAVGTTTVTATLNGVTSNGLVVNVSAATVTAVTITPPAGFTGMLDVGQQAQFSATATFSDMTTQPVTGTSAWTSSTPASVSIQSTGAASPGLATALAMGSSNIQATYQGVASNKIAVTVTMATLVSIAVTPNPQSIPVGQQQQFKATGTYSDTSTADITGTVTWASADPTKFTVSATGLVNAIASSFPNAVNLTATQGAIQGIAKVTTTSSTLTAVNVSCASGRYNLLNPQPANLSCIPAGFGLQVACWAQSVFSDGSTGDVSSTATWASTAPTVATTTGATGTCPAGFGGSTGQCEFLNIIGPTSGAGTTTATAAVSGSCGGGTCTGTSGSIQGYGGVTVDTTYGCNGALEISDTNNNPCGTTLNQGDKDQLTATAAFNGYAGACAPGPGQPPPAFNVTQAASWASPNPGVATVSSAAGTQGAVQAVSAGSVTLTANWTANGTSNGGSYPLVVNSKCLVSLAIAQAGSTYPQDVNVPLTVNGTYSDMTTKALSPSTTSVTFTGVTAQPATVPSVNPTEWVLDTSQFTGSGMLTETLKAQATGCSGPITSPAATITIDASALPASLTLSPAMSSIVIGGQEDFTATATYSTYGPFTVSQQCTPNPCWSSNPANTPSQLLLPAGADNTNTNLEELIGAKSTATAANYTLAFAYRNQSATAQLGVSGRVVTGISFGQALAGLPNGIPYNNTNYPTGVPANIWLTFPITISYSDGGSSNSLAGVAFSSTGTVLGAFTGNQALTKTAGTSTVTASISGSCMGGTCSATLPVTVDAESLTSLTATPNPLGMGENQSAAVQINAAFSGGAAATDVSTQVSSSSSNGAVASVATTSTGTSVTSHAIAQNGVTLTFALNGIQGTDTVNVSGTSTCITGLTVTPSNVNPLPQGAQQQFTATATFSSGPTQNATFSLNSGAPGSGWTSSNNNVASVVTAANNGIATGGATVGTATITATAIGQITILGTTYAICNGGNVSDTTVTGTASVTSSAAAVSAITLSTTQAGLQVLPIGESEQLVVTGTLTTGGTIPIAASQITFASNSVNAPVSGQGVVTGSAATASPATLTATYNPNNTLSSSITLSVANCGLPTVSVCDQVSSTQCVSPGQDLPVGSTANYTATATYTVGNCGAFGGPNPTFNATMTSTWSTTTPDATVNSSGVVTGQTLGANNGNESVCANHNTVPGCVGFNVVVLKSLTVTPSPVSVGVGGVQQLTVSATDNQNNAIPAPSVSWFVADPTVATINASNLLQAGSTSGTQTTFYAQAGTVQSPTVTVHVTPACISSVVLGTTTNATTMPTGQPFGVTVKCVNSNGSTATCPATSFTPTGFAATCPGGATLPSGQYCVGSAGTETVQVSVAGCTGPVSSTITITPTSATVSSLSLSTPTPQVGVNTAAQFITTAMYSDNSSYDVSSLATLSSDNLNVAVPNANPTDDVTVPETVQSQNTTGTANITSMWGAATSNTAALTVNTSQTLTGIVIASDASSTTVCATANSPCLATATNTDGNNTGGSAGTASYPGGGLVLQLHAYAIYNTTPTQSNGAGEITSQVTWSAADPSGTGTTIGSGTGTLTTGSAAAGVVTVTATQGTVSQTFAVTIDNTAITTASITNSAGGPPTATVPKGTAIYEVQIGTGGGGNYWATANYGWASSNTTTGTITALPPSTGATYTALQTSGTTNVTATRGTSTATLAVTDSGATPAYVVCAPASVNLSAVGDTAQLTATVHFSDGSSQDETATASWPGVQAHTNTNTSGVVRGLSAGTDTINVSYTANGVTASTTSASGQACSVTVQ